MCALPINYCLYVTWQGNGKISNYENRIENFEERNEENGYSPYRSTTAQQVKQ